MALLTTSEPLCGDQKHLQANKIRLGAIAALTP
jgi:hypothetical protein